MVTIDCGKVLVTAEVCVLPLRTLDLSQRSLLVSSTPAGCWLCLPVLFIIALPGGECLLVSAGAWGRLFFQTPE